MDNKKTQINELEDFYCIDCDGYRVQKFIKEMPDKTLLYICTKCGCENSLNVSE